MRISLIALLTIFGLAQTMGQDGPHRVYMYLDYFQDRDNQNLLCEVKYRPDRDFLQLADVEIEFYQVGDTNNLLGTVKTGSDGKARLNLNESELVRDTSGYAHFEAIFGGNEKYRKASRELSSKRIKLEIDGIEEDSTRLLNVTGYEILPDDEIDIDGKDVRILVKRTFSNLPIGEGSIDDGIFEMTFPDDLPGDTSGSLTVIAQIFEDDDYGTAEVRTDVAWGTPLILQAEQPRALWSRAPLWIIIAVTLAFAAAWYHYFLSISKLFKLRKL